MRRSVTALAVAGAVTVGLALVLGMTYVLAPGSVVPLLPGTPTTAHVPTPEVLVPSSATDLDGRGVLALPASSISGLVLQRLAPEQRPPGAVLEAEQQVRTELGTKDGIAAEEGGAAADPELLLAPAGAALVELSAPAGERRSSERATARGRRADSDAYLASRVRSGLTTTAAVVSTRDPRSGLRTRSVETLAGNPCPDSRGEVTLNVSLRLRARSAEVDIDHRVGVELGAVVDPQGELTEAAARLSVRTVSGAAGSAPEARSVVTGGGYAEFGAAGELPPVTAAPAATETGADTEQVAAGLSDARALATGALAAAQRRWLSGGCVRLSGTLPQVVETGSTFRRPLRLTSLVDGTPVDGELSVQTVGPGEASIGPDGDLVFRAGQRRGQETTLRVTATSSRGRVTVPFTIATSPEDIRVSGSWHGGRVSGVKCAGPLGQWRWDLFTAGGAAAGTVTFRLDSGLSGRISGSRSFPTSVGTITVTEAGTATYRPQAGEVVVVDQEGVTTRVSAQLGEFCPAG